MMSKPFSVIPPTSYGLISKLCVACFALAMCMAPVHGWAQEAEQGAPAADQAPAKPKPAKPRMPNEITYTSEVGDVRFPHKLHMKMGCNKCHHQIHAEPLDTPHQDYLDSSWIKCEICHGADAETRSKYYKCSGCHHSDLENIADETLSSKVVVHKSCWQCHQAGTGVAASEGCSDCHDKTAKQLDGADDLKSP
jgi:hypothetical protein